MTTPDSSLADLISPRSEMSMGTEAVDKILRALRRHLDMDVAFVAQFRADERIFVHVDAKARTPISPGDAAPLQEGYCQRVVDGRLPELIPDTRLLSAALAIPETAAIPIGSHLSVPIRLADGSVYGTFCCFGFQANVSLGSRDLQMMRVFADLLADQIDRDLENARVRNERAQRVRRVLSNHLFSTVLQPICNLETNRIAGFECLSRFQAEPQRPPNEWFSEANEVGLGLELELAAIRSSLAGLDSLPRPIYLTVNCSPDTILSDALLDTLQEVDVSRVVVEITEHAHVEDYARLLHHLGLLRALGLRVAIDDAGAGYASMRHILHIRPDIIKLDISLTRNIDMDPTRRALAAALIAFARETGAKIVAEGVETAAELNALRRLGIFKAQGYFLSQPVPLEEAALLLERPIGTGVREEAHPVRHRMRQKLP